MNSSQSPPPNTDKPSPVNENNQEIAPPKTPSLTLNSGQTIELNSELNAKLGLLRTIGITPELLLSSRFVDPNALLALLSAASNRKFIF